MTFGAGKMHLSPHPPLPQWQQLYPFKGDVSFVVDSLLIVDPILCRRIVLVLYALVSVSRKKREKKQQEKATKKICS